ncbi:MAG: DUF5694 domain-containing protein [Pseudomonadota bacterium]
MKWFIFGLVFLSNIAVASQEPDTKVMVIGTFHMANPNKDLHNVKSQDVLTPKAQKELKEVTQQLLEFKPTKVMVEWPKKVTSKRYQQYLKGDLTESRNEVVQLGFRLAKARQLTQVIGIDSKGRFPYKQLAKWAENHNQSSILETTNEMGKNFTSSVERMQENKHLSEVLRFVSTPEHAAFGQRYYSRMLLIGEGDKQPGAKLVSEWASRNYRICAKLLQNLEDKERAVVFYGSGHLYYLRRCIIDAPGVTLVEPSKFLSKR